MAEDAVDSKDPSIPLYITVHPDKYGWRSLVTECTRDNCIGKGKGFRSPIGNCILCGQGPAAAAINWFGGRLPLNDEECEQVLAFWNNIIQQENIERKASEQLTKDIEEFTGFRGDAVPAIHLILRWYCHWNNEQRIEFLHFMHRFACQHCGRRPETARDICHCTNDE